MSRKMNVSTSRNPGNVTDMRDETATPSLERTQPSAFAAVLPRGRFLFGLQQVAVDKDIFKAYASKMDIVRVLAMTSIVWGHALFGWENLVFIKPGYQVIQASLMQLGRIGTINFFIISGFFFNSKIQKFTVVSYLRYRLFSLIVPWLLFISFFVIIQLVQILTLKGLVFNSPSATAKLTLNLFNAAVFHAAFWFIPVSILSACLLIVFKKYINSVWFGILLVAITLFYCINLYYAWVSVNHARSFLGYVLFMWLGIQLNRHLSYVKFFIEKLSNVVLIPAIILAFALACREGWVLKSMGCLDSFGSIRVSNIVLSILVFLGLLKTNNMGWIHTLKPHAYIYGVYLVHSIIMLCIMPHISKFTFEHNIFASMPTAFLLQLLVFAGVISVTYGIVVVIKKSPIRFIIGRQ